MAQRVVPQAEDAEEAVLGAMMSDPGTLDECLEKLRNHHFYLDSNRTVFRVMEEMHRSGMSIDVLTLARELESRHSTPSRRIWRNGERTEDTVSESDLSFIGGKIRLAQLVNQVISTRNVGHHADLVVEAWGKRECIARFTEPMRGAWNGSSPLRVLREVEEALLELRGKVADNGRTKVVSAMQMAEMLEAKMKNPVIGTPEGAVPSPFSFLPPLQPGRLYVLGGYTGDGKSAVANQFIAAAMKGGKRTGLVSIEMGWEDVAVRTAASYGVPSNQAESGLIGPAYMDQMRHAIAEIARFNLDVIDDSTVNAAAIGRYQRIGRYEFLVIDHLHRIDTPDRKALEREVVAITTLARTERIPVLLLAQFHRPFGTDKFPRPTMASFRETGVIEQEAAAAWSIYRVRDELNEQTSEAEFLVLKNRYGSVGRHHLSFIPNQVRFIEIDRRRD